MKNIKAGLFFSLMMFGPVFTSESKKFDIETELREYNTDRRYQKEDGSMLTNQEATQRSRCNDLAKLWAKAVAGLDKHNPSIAQGTLLIFDTKDNTEDEEQAHLSACSKYLHNKYYDNKEYDSVNLTIIPGFKYGSVYYRRREDGIVYKQCHVEVALARDLRNKEDEAK